MNMKLNMKLNLVEGTYNVPTEVKYLSDAIDYLPKNVVLNKGLVGCGGTTIAIDDKESYIIVVPSIKMIKQKSRKHTNLIGVYGITEGGASDEKIQDNDRAGGCRKFMVTYDSLERLTLLLSNPKEYHLLIDELHVLSNAYIFRNDAIRRVLDNYERYRSYCFMTATPVEDAFVLTELQLIPVINLVWDRPFVKVVPVLCNKSRTGSAANITTNIIKGYLEGKTEGKAFIFVNSIKFAERIAKYLKLNKTNCRFIYGTSTESKGIKTYLPNSDIDSENTLITFLTSASFEGADIECEEGRSYIVSDGTSAHTCIDIQTSLFQIAGRIRNSINNDIVLITSPSEYTDLSLDDYNRLKDDEFNRAANDIKYINTNPKSARDIITVNNLYVLKNNVTSLFNVDENILRYDKYQFKLTKHTYKVKVNTLDELRSKRVELTSDEEIRKCGFEHNFLKRNPTFKETILVIKDLKEDNPLYLDALARYDFLKDAIKEVGFKGIEDRGYRADNLKAMLQTKGNSKPEYKVAKMIKAYSELSEGNIIEGKKLTEIFNNISQELGLDKRAKYSDYLITRPKTIRREDKVIKCVVIGIHKIIV